MKSPPMMLTVMAVMAVLIEPVGLLGGAPLGARTPPAADAAPGADDPVSTLVLPADRSVTLTWPDGTDTQMRVEPTAPGSPVLNPDWPARLNLLHRQLPARLRIGPIKITGSSSMARYRVGFRQLDRRILWYDRPVTPAPWAGEVGPYGVPHDRVVFTLRPERAGEQIVRVPLYDDGVDSAASAVEINGHRVAVRFDLNRRETVATAAAGIDLATAHQGVLAGNAQRIPIYMGVERPVRRLVLKTPFRFGPFGFGELQVRVSDYGDTSDIPESEIDPGETLVKGRGSDDVMRRIQIGTDALAACSRLVFDKRAGVIELSCLPAQIALGRFSVSRNRLMVRKIAINQKDSAVFRGQSDRKPL